MYVIVPEGGLSAAAPGIDEGCTVAVRVTALPTVPDVGLATTTVVDCACPPELEAKRIDGAGSEQTKSVNTKIARRVTI